MEKKKQFKKTVLKTIVLVKICFLFEIKIVYNHVFD